MIEAILVIALLAGAGFVLYFMPDVKEFMEEVKKQNEERRK